jgi:Fatty acid hydroxylase superfamily
VAFPLLDYFVFVWHWLNHRLLFLWSFHNVHHTDLDRDISTAFRFHFGEVLLSVLQRSLVVAFLGVGPYALKVPFTADNWEQAKIAPLEPWMLSAGWKKRDAGEGLGKQFHHRLPDIREAVTPGETITLQFRGRTAGLYDLIGPDGGGRWLSWTA